MAKNKKNETPTLSLNGVDYKIEDLSDEQKIILNHINDLQNKIDGANRNLHQMKTGQNAYITALTEDLNNNTNDD